MTTVPGGNCPGWQLSRVVIVRMVIDQMAIVQVTIVLRVAIVLLVAIVLWVSIVCVASDLSPTVCQFG